VVGLRRVADMLKVETRCLPHNLHTPENLLRVRPLFYTLLEGFEFGDTIILYIGSIFEASWKKGFEGFVKELNMVWVKEFIRLFCSHERSLEAYLIWSNEETLDKLSKFMTFYEEVD